MGERAARYRGAVGLSYYGYTPCCGAKLFARSLQGLDDARERHREHCPKAKARRAAVEARYRPAPPVQEHLELELEAPHAS